MNPSGASLRKRQGDAQLDATFVGEPLSPTRRVLAPDVKAATAHGLRIEARPDGFQVRIALDV